MAITNPGVKSFIPEIWAAAILEPYEKNLVFGQNTIVNSTYSGEVKGQGSTVHVSTMSTPTVRAYEAGKDIEVEDLNTSDTSLVIDQGSYFAFRVDDVSELQAAGPLRDPATRSAGIALRDQADQYIAKVMYDGAAHNLGKIEIDPKSDDAWGVLLELRKTLNEVSVPLEGRFVIVDGWFESALLNDKRFTQVDASGTSDGLRNGMIGRALGFDVLVSNNITSVVKRERVVVHHPIIAGVPDATTFVSQIEEIESFRDPNRFGDIVRGLHIYGAKVFRHEGLVVADTILKQVSPPPVSS